MSIQKDELIAELESLEDTIFSMAGNDDKAVEIFALFGRLGELAAIASQKGWDIVSGPPRLS